MRRCGASQAMRDAVRKPWDAAVPVGKANRRRASESLDDVPQDPRLPAYPPIGPTDRLPDLYGSLSALLGISLNADRRGLASAMPAAFDPDRGWAALVKGQPARLM